MRKIENQDYSKKSIASLWVDFVLSLMLCATIVTFTIFAKKPVDDIRNLVNMIFDFIKNNIFILILFLMIMFIVLRLKIVVNETLNKKSNKKVKTKNLSHMSNFKKENENK